MIKQQTEEPSQCGPSCGPLFMVLRDAVKAYSAHNDRFIEFVVELQDISFPGETFKDQMYKMGQDLTEFEFDQAPWEKHHHEDIEAYLPQESEIEDDEDEDFYEEKRDELLAKKDIRIWIGGFRVLHSGVLYVGGIFMGSWGGGTGTDLDRGEGVVEGTVGFLEGGFSVGFWCYGFGSRY